ncbi:hypothetical protein EDB92DRAFT_1898896 [Lactarius akahatsu]|uniref:Uncharacterized protein n=1 Tax=Lactarius akahatsu TaxID=416441 RepID=A0AAD4Q608_9AGAM|nr:hypothetical protein EDB92DRAFT_1898896 [Lactarius akahatsu]
MLSVTLEAFSAKVWTSSPDRLSRAGFHRYSPVHEIAAQIPSIELTIAERSQNPFSFESPSYDLRVDMEEPNNDIDTETLQAQVDLAMAQAQNLVASWLPASSGSLTQSSSRAAEAEAELQALLRRPPRYVFPLFFYILLCRMRALLYLPPHLPFMLPGWASVRHSQRVMPLRRCVSCRNYRVIKSAPGRRRMVRTQTWWV